MEEPLAMDLMPLNLKRETVCDAGVGGTAGAASTSWSGRGERKMELRNMVMGVCGVVRSWSSGGDPYIRCVV
jgi:hypothetical protein